MSKWIVTAALFFSTLSYANDYRCVGIGGDHSDLWRGRQFTYRFLSAVDLKLIDQQTGEEIPLVLDHVYTTGNRYLAQGIYFFLTSGLISEFKPIEKGKINMTTYDRSGQVTDFAQLDCVLTYH